MENFRHFLLLLVSEEILLGRPREHCTAGLLFDWFGFNGHPNNNIFSCLLKSNPAVRWYFPLWLVSYGRTYCWHEEQELFAKKNCLLLLPLLSSSIFDPTNCIQWNFKYPLRSYPVWPENWLKSSPIFWLSCPKK